MERPSPSEAALPLEKLGYRVSEKADPSHRDDQSNREASQRQDAIEHCVHDTCPCLLIGAQRDAWCTCDVAWHLGVKFRLESPGLQ